MNNPVTRGRTLAAAIAIAVLGGLLTIFPADATIGVSSPVWLDTVADTGTGPPDPDASFPTPIILTPVAGPNEVFPGEAFNLTTVATMVLSEDFLIGAAETACSVFGIKVEQAEINNITLPVPLPANANGSNETFLWSTPGLVAVGSWAGNDPDCTLDTFTPTLGGVQINSPATTFGYTATGAIGSSIDFSLDETPRNDPISKTNPTQTVNDATHWWFVRIPVNPPNNDVFINVGFGAQVGTKRPVAPVAAGTDVVLVDPLPPNTVLAPPASSYSVFLNETGTETADVETDGLGNLVATCTSASCNDGDLGTGDPIVPPPSVVFFGAYTQPAFHSIEIVQPPVPHVNVDDIVGQKVETHARSGDTLDFSGADWAGPASVTRADLCDDAAGTTGCQALDNRVAAVDAGGNLTGTGDVPAGATTGSRFLVVETDAPEISDPDFGTPTITVLGAPTLSAAPDPLPLGGTANLSGSNWNPNSLVEVVVSDPGNPLSNQVTGVAAVNSSGALTGTLLVDDALLTALGIVAVPPVVDVTVNDVDPDTGVATATYPLTVSLNQAILNPDSRGGDGPGGGNADDTAQLQQIVVQEITPDVLTFSQQDAVINLTPITLDGTTQQTTGALNQVTVVDARGTLEGWTINVTMTDLTTPPGGVNRIIPAGNVAFTPSCNTVDGIPTELTEGVGGLLDNTTPLLLCDGAVGGGGGTFTGDATLEATIPSSVASGTYTGVLTLLIF